MDFKIFGYSISLWIVVPAFLVGWIAIGWTLKKIAFAWFRRLTQKTETQIDDIVIDAANIPITLMIFVWGVAALFHVVAVSQMGVWGHYVTVSSKIATILAGILFVDLFLVKMLQVYSLKIELLRISHSFTSIVVHALVLGIGGLILLDSFGISITPIVASLGIGSLAVALALQPTLENLFSGVQILLDQPVSPGHFIRLESGEEGYVEKVGWRSTWVRQPSNNMVIIPNKQLVNARVINYYYPSKDLVFLVPIGVHYASDLSKVERVALDVAREIVKTVPGAVPDFDPVVRFHTFNSSSIDCNVVMKAKEFGDTALVRHEFIKAISQRFSKENIVIPYPVVALNTDQEKAALNSIN